MYAFRDYGKCEAHTKKECPYGIHKTKAQLDAAGLPGGSPKASPREDTPYVLTPRSIEAAKKATTKAGKDEEENIQEKQKLYRVNAVQAVSSNILLALCVCSLVAKSIISRFLLWGQKAVKKQNELAAKAKKLGRTYLGPTAVSRLVCGEADRM